MHGVDPVETLGIVAASFTTIAFLPQVVRILRTRDTRSISLWTYLLFCTGVALWLAYGLLRADLPIILANVVTLALAGAVLALKLRSG